MAGTLTISTLSDGTNSTSSTNCIQGSAKAWVKWTGSTGAVLNSYNVSSITRASTGNYFVNFTNALPNANYAVSASGSAGALSQPPFINYYGTGSVQYTAPTTSGFYLGILNYNVSAYYDPTIVTATINSN